MIRKLFGNTEEEQFKYLRWRIIALAISLVILLIGIIFGEVLEIEFFNVFGTVGEGMCAFMMLIFGWAIMKGIFGFATVGALFSRNVMIGVIIFVAFIIIGYLGGIFVAFVGVCRFFVLLKHRKERV